MVAAPRRSPFVPTARQRRLALLAIGLTTILWGLGPLVAHLLLKEVQPFTLAALRLSIASAGLMLLSLRDLRRAPRPLHVPWRRLMVLGALGMAIYYATFNYSLLFASTIVVAVVFAVSPAVTALLAVMFLRERVSVLRWGGIVLSIAGVCLLSLGGSEGSGPNSLLGAAIGLAGVFAWGGYVTISKGVHPRLPQTVATTVIALSGLVLILPLAAIELVLYGQGQISTGTWLLLIQIGLVNSALAYLTFNWGLRYLEASTASTVLQAMIVVTMAAGVLVLGEPLTIVEIAAAATVLTGVWLASRPNEATARNEG
jgi:drug/metabolite transporter (DMT)-like permease